MSFFHGKILALFVFFPICFVHASQKSPDYELDFESVTTLSNESKSQDYILQAGLTPISAISDGSETISFFDYCGNEVLNDGEMCDKSNFGELTCENYGFERGLLRCSFDCTTISTDECYNSGGSRSGVEKSLTPQDFTNFQPITIPDISEDETQILAPEEDPLQESSFPEIDEEIESEISERETGSEKEKKEKITLEAPKFSSPILVERTPINKAAIQVTEKTPIKNDEKEIETETLHEAANSPNTLQSEKINNWCGGNYPTLQFMSSADEECKDQSANTERYVCPLFCSNEREIKSIKEKENFFSEKKYCLLAILIAFFVGIITGWVFFPRKQNIKKEI